MTEGLSEKRQAAIFKSKVAKVKQYQETHGANLTIEIWIAYFAVGGSLGDMAKQFDKRAARIKWHNNLIKNIERRSKAATDATVTIEPMDQ